MQLIDRLEERADSVSLMEGVTHARVQWDDASFNDWAIVIGLQGVGEFHPITEDAWITLLNHLKVPTKLIKRMSGDVKGRAIATEVIDYHFFDREFSYLVEEIDDVNVITQVFDVNGTYMPMVNVNDLVFDVIGYSASVDPYNCVVEGDKFYATYISDEKVRIGGNDYNIGVSVHYSDCFTVTPRFDGVLILDGATVAFPIEGRKFRVAGNTIAEINVQIRDFIALALDSVREGASKMDKGHGLDLYTLVPVEKTVTALFSRHRISDKVGQALIDKAPTPNISGNEFVDLLGSASTDDFTTDIVRAVRIALGDWLANEAP